MQKNKNIIFIGLIILSILGGFVYYYFNKHRFAKNESTPNKSINENNQKGLGLEFDTPTPDSKYRPSEDLIKMSNDLISLYGDVSLNTSFNQINLYEDNKNYKGVKVGVVSQPTDKKDRDGLVRNTLSLFKNNNFKSSPKSYKGCGLQPSCNYSFTKGNISCGVFLNFEYRNLMFVECFQEDIQSL